MRAPLASTKFLTLSIGIAAGDRIGAADVFDLKRLAIGGQNELSILRRRLGAGAQGSKCFIHPAGLAGGDMDIAALKHGFVSTIIGVCTDLRLGPSSRPLPYRLPPPSSG